MTDTTIRKRPKHIDPAGEPIRAAAWQNLYFRKDGQFRVGSRTHDSEVIARESAQETIKSPDYNTLEWPDGFEIVYRRCIDPITKRILVVDYSHHMQVPAKP